MRDGEGMFGGDQENSDPNELNYEQGKARVKALVAANLSEGQTLAVPIWGNGRDCGVSFLSRDFINELYQRGWKVAGFKMDNDRVAQVDKVLEIQKDRADRTVLVVEQASVLAFINNDMGGTDPAIEKKSAEEQLQTEVLKELGRTINKFIWVGMIRPEDRAPSQVKSQFDVFIKNEKATKKVIDYPYDEKSEGN